MSGENKRRRAVQTRSGGNAVVQRVRHVHVTTRDVAELELAAFELVLAVVWPPAQRRKSNLASAIA